MSRDKMDWDTFARKVRSCQRGFMGEPNDIRAGKDDFFEFPTACICKKPFDYASNETLDDRNDLEEGPPFSLDSSYSSRAETGIKQMFNNKTIARENRK